MNKPKRLRLSNTARAMMIKRTTTNGIPQYRRLQIYAKANRLARKRGSSKITPLDINQADDWVIGRIMRRRNREGDWPILKNKVIQE